MRPVALLALVLFVGANWAPGAAPMESSYCVVVGVWDAELPSLIDAMDPYVSDRAMNRSRVTPNGIEYEHPDGVFIVHLLRVGPVGTELAIFPVTATDLVSEVENLRLYIDTNIRPLFSVASCETVKGFGKSKIYGYG
jgi:hypothetical protein